MRNQIDLATLEGYLAAEGAQLESERVTLETYLAQVQEGLATIEDRQQFLENLRQALESKRRYEEQEANLKAELAGLLEQEAALRQELVELAQEGLQVDQQLAAWRSMPGTATGEVSTVVSNLVKPQAAPSGAAGGTMPVRNTASASVTAQPTGKAEESETTLVPANNMPEMSKLEFMIPDPADFDPYFIEAEAAEGEVAQVAEVLPVMVRASPALAKTQKAVEKTGVGAGTSLTGSGNRRPAPL